MAPQVRPATPEAIAEAGRIIASGGLVAFPTETVYGLGAHALDPMAVARIFEVKQRPRFDPLIVHVADVGMAESLWQFIPAIARQLIQAFWPGPLTLVLPKRAHVPDIVTAGLPTVAVRMPGHPVALALIRAASVPIAAPSANPFGYLSPTRAEHVVAMLGDRVDLILDGGPCPYGVESTVILIEGDRVAVLRPGALPIEDVERMVGPVDIRTRSARPQSPGQLPRHYAPRVPVRIGTYTTIREPPDRHIGYLAWQTPPPVNVDAVEVLSPTGNLREAAARLFDCLHRLEAAGVDVIYAEPVPEVGLGRAIMDRLQRMAHDGTPRGDAEKNCG